MTNPCPKFFSESPTGAWIVDFDDKQRVLTPLGLAELDKRGFVEWLPFIQPIIPYNRCIRWPFIEGEPLAYVSPNMEYRPWHTFFRKKNTAH